MPARSPLPGWRATSVSAGLAVQPGAVGPPSERAVRILDAVERIPRGRVMTYGDVAEYLGGTSARAVGDVLSRYGREVPWQRVVHADGSPHRPAEALPLLRSEGCALTPDGTRVDMARARWDGS